jgi:hypothetical protein
MFTRVRDCTQDASVAALAVALYAAEGPEARLLMFLKVARTAEGRPLYDPHAALRVCRDAGCLQVNSFPLWSNRKDSSPTTNSSDSPANHAII